jgi:hypothetical protein
MLDLNYSWFKAREAHYRKHFGPLAEPIMHSTDERTPHIDMYQFRPNSRRDWWTIVTGGMSERRQPFAGRLPRRVARRTELLVYASKPSRWIFSAVKRIAEMPFDTNEFLHWGHTVVMSTLVADRLAPLSRFFCTPPFFERETLQSLRLGRERVDFLWLIPITEAEHTFLEHHGPQALTDAFAARQLFPLLDKRRESCV